MSFSVALKLNIAATETLTGDDLNANTPILHSGYDIERTLTSATTPDVTKASFQTVTMSGGAATVDLTSLLLNAAAVTLTGLKPRAIRVKALAANSGNVTVVKGASNGYDGMGGSFSVVLEPGQAFMFDFYTAGNAVASNNKTIDLSGTGTDGVQFSTIAGPT